MIWQKIVPWLAAGWFLVFWEWAFQRPSHLPILGLLALILPATLLIVHLKRIKKQGLPVRSLGLPLPAVMVSGLLASLFLERAYLAQSLVIFIALLICLDFYYLDLFSRRDRNYPIGLLEQINLGLWGFFLFLSALVLFGWITFFAESLWPVLLAAALIFYFVFLEIFFLRKIENRAIYLYSLILDLLAVEFFWVISLWPVGFVIKGLVFALSQIYLIYLIQSYLVRGFNKKLAIIYFCLTSILIVVVLGLARWI